MIQMIDKFLSGIDPLLVIVFYNFMALLLVVIGFLLWAIIWTQYFNRGGET